MGKTKIEWTGKNGYTWNPIVGCSKISPGCLHCYAEIMAVRLAAMGQEKYQRVIGPISQHGQKYWPIEGEKYRLPLIGKNGWNGNCYLSESELEKPFHWKEPRRIFVSSMADLFHENNPDENIDLVMDVIAGCQLHTFLFLTKRADRMVEYFKAAEARLMGKWTAMACVDGSINTPSWPLPNLITGVTAENQEYADLRIPQLLKIQGKHFVSIEPMLGPVDLTKIKVPEKDCCIEDHGYIDYHFNSLSLCDEDNYHQPPEKLDWVILGGENGHGARPINPGWVRKVRDDCQAAGVPFFFKGWGMWEPGIELTHEWSPNKIEYSLKDKKIGDIVPWKTVLACDKKNYGKATFQVKTEKGAIILRKSKEKNYLLDGVKYHQFPEGI